MGSAWGWEHKQRLLERLPESGQPPWALSWALCGLTWIFLTPDFFGKPDCPNSLPSIIVPLAPPRLRRPYLVVWIQDSAMKEEISPVGVGIWQPSSWFLYSRRTWKSHKVIEHEIVDIDMCLYINTEPQKYFYTYPFLIHSWCKYNEYK